MDKIKNNLKVELVDIDTLIPYINNTKKHPKEQIEQIKASIVEFGFNDPLGVKDNIVIVGNGRLQAAKELGIKKVPIIRLDHLSEAQKKAYAIAHNKLTMNSDFDEEILKVELEALQEMNFDLELIGFSGDEIDEILDNFEDIMGNTDNEKADEVPEVEEENIVIKKGDLIELGEHRLLCGDSTDEDDVKRLMNGKIADMVFTDPPYGMKLDTDYSSLDWGDRKGKKYERVKGDNEDFKPELITKIFDFFGYCKEIFLWGADYFYKYIPNFDDGHFIVWDKTLESNGDAGSNSEFELLWTKTKHKRVVIHFNWFRYFGLSKQDIKQRIHPTQKPLQVCEPFIEKYSKELQIVVDLFLGSGSTLIACENLKRKCYGMELDEKYCQVIIQRWCDYTGIDEIKINGKKIKWSEYKEKVKK